jgi:poly-beta-1,6-N-acetyl-D-glucosamine synthase
LLALMAQRLLLVSPVYNEAAYLELVAQAVAQQTRPPDLWVLVDDASTDGTPEILAELSQRIDFLRVVTLEPSASKTAAKDKLAFAADARSFLLGVAGVDWRSFTHIAKLDGDTELPPQYFERLLAEFARDPQLGLAGGVYADPEPGGGWKVMRIPVEHHVPGTLKCYSLACWEAIDGIQERLGWDTIDETYARMRGYRTRAFPELVTHHHRPAATADGALRGRARHGQCAYVAHFTLAWVMLRAFKVARLPPRGLSGLAFLYGYVESALRGVERVEDPAFRTFVRRELRARLLGPLRRRAGRSPVRFAAPKERTES